jgi:hypothetical protein
MTITEYLLNIALVGLVLLQVRGRKLTVRNMLLPLGIAAWVATQFLHAVPTAGNDMLLELSGALAGGVLGTLAALSTTVRREGAGAIAKAGALAATLWVVGIGARVAFSLFAQHGGERSITHFSVAHHITSGQAWVAACILMALAEVTSRTGVLYVKAHHLGASIERRRPAGSALAG